LGNVGSNSLERYNALGPSAMGDLRRSNGAPSKVLTPELLERLRARIAEPPPDDGVWTSGKVARCADSERNRPSFRFQIARDSEMKSPTSPR
jgi:hypothetical protein